MINDVEKDFEEQTAGITWERNGPQPLSIHIALALSRCAAGEIGQDRVETLLHGIRKYQSHKFKREEMPFDIVWQKGCVRLLHCPATTTEKKKTALLIVPSLINHFVILDLLPQKSFIRYLAGQDIDVYLLDWGGLAGEDAPLTMDDVVTQCVGGALSHINDTKPDNVIHTLGYCMGGTLLAAALAQQQHTKVSSAIFLASPWDFHAGDKALTKRVKAGKAVALQTMLHSSILPSDWIQSVFAGIDPDHAIKKFERFLNMEEGSDEEVIFVAAEDWLNDGVDLPSSLARSCILDWYDMNKPHTGEWCVGGTAVDLSAIKAPCLIVSSKRDRLVPYESALAMQDILPQADVIEPDCGHVGMMIGRGAAQKMWDPLLSWIEKKQRAIMQPP